MTTTYTPLPLSKLIAERLPELETEHNWNLVVPTNIHVSCGCDGILPKVSVPALTFTDLLRAIEMLGEEEGWEDVPCHSSDTSMCPSSYQEQYRLFGKYLADRLTIGEHTVSYLTELFTNEK